MGDWADLPKDVLEEVAKKLRHMELLQFGSVCKPWRLLYLENRQYLPKDLPISLLCHPRAYRAPFLLQACKPDSNSRKYICVVDEMVQGEICLPEAVNKWICGSSLGWLTTMDIKGQDISLLNPFTRHELKLPSLATFPELLNHLSRPDDACRHCFDYILKVIMSSDPISSPEDCVVMAIVGNFRRLSFCKIGDGNWTNVEHSPGGIEDVTYYKGRFYAVTQLGLTMSYDGKNPNARDQTEVVAFEPCSWEIPKRYLVPSGGDLLQVWRFYKDPYDDDDDDDDDDDYDYDDDDYGGDNYDSGEEVDYNNNNEDEDENNNIKLSYKPYQTLKFKVLKLVKRKSVVYCDLNKQDEGFHGSARVKYCWSNAESLRDRLLFIGYNGSFSMPASTHPNCKGTRIYFSDDFHGEHIENFLIAIRPGRLLRDIGVYDMENKNIHDCYGNDLHDPMPAIWIVPKPW